MENKRLIDANALLDKLERLVDLCNPRGYVFSAHGIAEEIGNAPTVDAVEVVHGRWLWSEENECFVCSNCGMAALNNYRGNSAESNYCPNCGAKMDGGAP